MAVESPRPARSRLPALERLLSGQRGALEAAADAVRVALLLVERARPLSRTGDTEGSTAR